MLTVPIVIVLQVVFAGSLALVRSRTDVDAIRTHIREAFASGVLADDQDPKVWILRGGHQFTECGSLNVAIDSQSDAWRSALAPKLHFGMVDTCMELHKTVDGVEAPSNDYSRYWHGYRLVLWPLLDRFGVPTLRVVTALLVTLGGIVFFFGLRAAIGLTPAIVLCLVLFLLTDMWRIWRISSHGISMAFILGGVGGFALLVRRNRSATLWVLTAAMLGAVFNFIDLMINPPMMPMLLAFVVLAVAARPAPIVEPRDALRPIPLAATVAAAWFLGYAGTWALKWGLAIWLADDSLQTATGIFDRIGFRLFGVEAGSRMALIPLLPTVEMILKAFESVGSIVVALLAAAVYCHLQEHRDRFDRRQFHLLLSPILIVFVWFELLSNHTQLHPNFVYRSASAAVALTIAAALMASGVEASPVSL